MGASVATLIVGCASMPTQAPVAEAAAPITDLAALRRLRDRLITAGDADSLAAAWLVESNLLWDEHHHPRDSASLAALLLRATETAPTRRDLAVLRLRWCMESTACNLERAQAQLRTIDPKNGFAWLVALHLAALAHDPVRIRAAVRGLAASTAASLYWTALDSHLTRAIMRESSAGAPAAFETVTGTLAALLLPALHPLSMACGAGLQALPDLLQDCRSAAHALELSDTMLLRGYGLRLTARLWPADSPQHRRALADTRALQYQLEAIAREGAFEKLLLADPAELLKLLSDSDSEQQMWVAMLRRAGIRPDPPSGWAPLPVPVVAR